MANRESTVESEIKLRVPDPDGMHARLEASGFQISQPRMFEANVVYDTPAGDLRTRGELLRLRRAGDAVVLTYKGKSQNGRHKVREELEITVSDFTTCETILNRLALRPTFRYEKYRTEYRRKQNQGVVVLDETPIGCYLEIEGPPGWIDDVASELGFTEADYITASYGRLYFDHCHATGNPATGMVFTDH